MSLNRVYFILKYMYISFFASRIYFSEDEKYVEITFK